MIQQSTVNACVKAYYSSNEDTDYGKIQAVLRTYDAMRETNTAATGMGDANAAALDWINSMAPPHHPTQQQHVATIKAALAAQPAPVDAAELQALADAVSITNATGNEDLFIAAVQKLVDGVRKFRPEQPAPVVGGDTAGGFDEIENMLRERTFTQNDPDDYLPHDAITNPQSFHCNGQRYYHSKLDIEAANAIYTLGAALASQIEITNTERASAERSAALLAARPGGEAPIGYVDAGDLQGLTLGHYGRTSLHSGRREGDVPLYAHPAQAGGVS